MGLSAAEAEVYAFLVRHSPATGYRVAQALSRPVGAVYKAIESLEDKGALYTCEDDGNRVARAAAPAEFIARLRRRLDDDALALEALAEEADLDEPDDLLYRLRDRDATLERARSLIQDAQSFVLASACPVFVDELGPAFEAAADRVPVAVKTFAPSTLRAAQILEDPRGLRAVESGPGQWLHLVSDGRVFLHALFSDDGAELRTAHWSANPLLNWSTYSGLCSHMTLSVLRPLVKGAAPHAELMKTLTCLEPLETSASFGKSMLIAQHRAPSPSKRGRPRRGA